MLTFYLAGIPLVFVLSWALILLVGRRRIFAKDRKDIALTVLLTTVGWPLLVFMVAFVLTGDSKSSSVRER